MRNVKVLTLEALGRTFAYAETPDNGSPYDPLPRHVGAAVQALASLDQKLAIGEPIDGEHAALQISLAKARAQAKVARDRLAKAEHELYTPPKADDPTLDGELRAYLRDLTPERRGELFKEMGEGKHPGVLQALARFPVPHPDAESARALYRNLAERNNPKALQEIEQQRAELSWFASATDALGNIVDEATAAGALPASVLVEGD